MVAVIEDIAGKTPLSISVISISTAQILFKEEDLPSFQKLLSSKMIQLVERRLSTERYCSFSTPIPEQVLQESSLCCVSEPTRSYHSSNIDQGSNVGEAKISQCYYPEAMELHNKEGHHCFSTVSGRNGCTVNKLEVVVKSQQKCEICDKIIQERSFNSHLKTEGHNKKSLSTASSLHQPQQSNANHIQP
jgi:hypothetical protein